MQKKKRPSQSSTSHESLHFPPTKSERIKLPWLAPDTARELPPARVPRPGDVDQSPLDRRRDRGPVRPQALLDGAVEVEQEEGDDVEGAGLGDGALAPRLESEGGGGLLGGPGLRRVGVVGERGDGPDLRVEVVGEGLLEPRHDALQLRAREVGRRLQRRQVRLELGEPVQEGLVLPVRLRPDGLVAAEHGLHLGEERDLLVVVVRLDELEPRQGVPDEGCLVCFLHVRSLQVD